MSPFKWLNILLFLENFFGIYRNYGDQKKIKKYLIILQISAQIMLYTLYVMCKVYLMFRDDFNQMKLIFFSFGVATYIDCVSSMTAGICYSNAFTSYLRSITHAAEYLKEDKKLIKTLKKMFYSGIAFIIFSFLLSAYRSTEAFETYSPSLPLVILIPIVSLQVVIRITIVFQHLMLYVVIMIVVHLTKWLTSLVSTVQVRCDISSDEQCDITREQVQEWVELYRDLVNCCQKVTLCFGRQYFFSLVVSITQYILVTYEIFYTCILKGEYACDGVRIMSVLLSYVSVMIMPVIAGQMARNQGVKLHRNLVRLYNKIIESGEAEAKLLKDFIRLLKKSPLDIKLSTKASAGMYMLPVILTLGVNYVIVMLQFNHVI